MNIGIHFDTKCWFIRNSNAVNDHAICFFLKKLNKCNHWHIDSQRSTQLICSFILFCFQVTFNIFYVFCALSIQLIACWRRKKEVFDSFRSQNGKSSINFCDQRQKKVLTILDSSDTFYKHRDFTTLTNPTLNEAKHTTLRSHSITEFFFN